MPPCSLLSSVIWFNISLSRLRWSTRNPLNEHERVISCQQNALSLQRERNSEEREREFKHLMFRKQFNNANLEDWRVNVARLFAQWQQTKLSLIEQSIGRRIPEANSTLPLLRHRKVNNLEERRTKHVYRPQTFGFRVNIFSSATSILESRINSSPKIVLEAVFQFKSSRGWKWQIGMPQQGKAKGIRGVESS